MEWLALGDTDMAKQHHEDGSLAWKVVQVRGPATVALLRSIVGLGSGSSNGGRRSVELPAAGVHLSSCLNPCHTAAGGLRHEPHCGHHRAWA